MLDARADDVGSRIHWEMHVRAGGDPETVGLTAGAGHVFIYGPVRLDDRAVAALRAVAPVVAVDAGRPSEAGADLRALLGSADYPPPERPAGPQRVVPPRMG